MRRTQPLFPSRLASWGAPQATRAAPPVPRRARPNGRPARRAHRPRPPPGSATGVLIAAYTVVDGQGNSKSASATVTVTPVNDAPTLTNGASTSLAGTVSRRRALSR